MYLTDEKLISRIRMIAGEAAERSNNSVRYEEYIALPYYGQIILRFDLILPEYTLNEVEACEKMLYELAGDEFMVDFMGSVYRKVGVDYSDLDGLFSAFSARFADGPIKPSVHAEGIRADADRLLRAAGLELDSRVWEIQIEDGEYILLIMGERSMKIKEVDIGARLTVGEVCETSCDGLIKAAFHARRNGISLARVLLSQ